MYFKYIKIRRPVVIIKLLESLNNKSRSNYSPGKSIKSIHRFQLTRSEAWIAIREMARQVFLSFFLFLPSARL